MIKIFYPMNTRACVLLMMYLLSPFLRANSGLSNVKEQYEKYDRDLTGSKTSDLLGLCIEELIKKSKLSEANKLLNQRLLTENAPVEIIHYWLAKIAMIEGRYPAFREHLRLASDIGILKNTVLVKQIYDTLPPSEKNWLVQRLIDEGFFNRPQESSCPFFELNQRKNRADFIYQLNKNHRLQKKIRDQLFYELYVLLPEVIDAPLLEESVGFLNFFKRLKAADLVKRMELLLTFGKNIETRNTLAASVPFQKKMSHSDICELSYVDAKVDRKLRRYDTARTRFASIIAECGADTQRKARYMDLMIASMMGDEKSLPKFSSFVASYPTHSLSDDVLIFKAGLLLEKNRVDEAEQALGQLIEQFPTGDMIHRALFLRAFTWAKAGLTEQAIGALGELLRISASDTLDFAQAQYWMARLSIFSDLESMVNPRKKGLVTAKKQLRELVYSPSRTVYSWLALNLLHSLGEKVIKKTDQHKPNSEAKIVAGTGDKDLRKLETLVVNGFRTEALELLDDIVVDAKKIDRAARLASFYDMLNRPEAGHQKLVRCDADLALSLSRKIPQTFARLSYPRPFAQVVDSTIMRVDVPDALIFSIMRQESGFLSQSCSWAGAKGLMQLIYSSALNQGRVWAINGLSEHDLYLPHINVFIASSLLQSYWERFGNLAVGLAAYNAGPTMAKSWLTKNKGAPLDTFIENISFKETRAYVKNVLGGTFAYAVNEGSIALPRLELSFSQPD